MSRRDRGQARTIRHYGGRGNPDFTTKLTKSTKKEDRRRFTLIFTDWISSCVHLCKSASNYEFVGMAGFVEVGHDFTRDWFLGHVLSFEKGPLDETEQKSLVEIQERVERIRTWYNEERLHSALNFPRPVDYYRGDPEALLEERRRKIALARHQRKETNLGKRQRTLPFGADTNGRNYNSKRPGKVSR